MKRRFFNQTRTSIAPGRDTKLKLQMIKKPTLPDVLPAPPLTETPNVPMVMPYTEIPDADSLPADAQYAGANVTSITGSTGAGDYQDLFRFTWDGGLLEAATNGLLGSSCDFDTILFLFDSTGLYITSNRYNRGPDGLAGSYISANLSAGDYLLGITGYGFAISDSGGVLIYDARDASGKGFQHDNGSGILTSWGWGGTPSPAADPSTGNYTIGINKRKS